MHLHTLFFFSIFCSNVGKSSAVRFDYLTREPLRRCEIQNELYWAVIQQFFAPVEFIKVVYIEEPNTTQLIDPAMDSVLNKFSEGKCALIISQKIEKYAILAIFSRKQISMSKQRFFFSHPNPELQMFLSFKNYKQFPRMQKRFSN